VSGYHLIGAREAVPGRLFMNAHIPVRQPRVDSRQCAGPKLIRGASARWLRSVREQRSTKRRDWKFQVTTPNASTNYVYFNYSPRTPSRRRRFQMLVFLVRIR
jgi:hypothetical protein